MKLAPLPLYPFNAYPQAAEPVPAPAPTDALQQLVVYRREERFATCRQHIEVHRRTFYKLSLIGEGGGRFRLDDDVVEVGPQSLLLVAPGTALSWHLRAETQTGLYCFFSPDFYDAGLLPGYQLRSVLAGGAPYVHHAASATNYTELRQVGEQLYAQQAQPEKARHCLRLLLADCRRWAQPAPTASIVVQQFQHLLEARLASGAVPILALDSYAAALCVTTKQLSAHCRQATGLSAAHLVRKRVATEARRLLTGTQLPISDIAYQLTFYDVPHFSRWFKQVTGQAPSAYREQFASYNY